jgi:ADP-ribose pyrophosphatase YjhB (NUDIX family)
MKKNGPWTIKKSKVVYKTPWLKVVEDTVIRPDGKNGIYSTVSILPGVSVLPITKNREVILLKNFQYAVGKSLITAIGGSIDKNETPEAAAIRELKEEAGINAKKLTPLGLTHAITSGIISSPNYMFLVEGITEGMAKPDGTESIKKIKMTLKEAIEKVMNGEITHSVTALLVLKARLLYK